MIRVFGHKIDTYNLEYFEQRKLWQKDLIVRLYKKYLIDKHTSLTGFFEERLREKDILIILLKYDGPKNKFARKMAKIYT